MEIKIKKGKLRSLELSELERSLIGSCESRIVYVPFPNDRMKMIPKYLILWGNGFGNPFRLYYLKSDDDSVFSIHVDRYLESDHLIEDLFEGDSDFNNLHFSLPFSVSEGKIYEEIKIQVMI